MNPDPDAFFAAIAAGDLAGVETLLAADPALASARPPGGASALMFALYVRQPGIAGRIRARRGPLDVFEASALGEAERLRELLGQDAGAVRQVSEDGFTALHLAAFFGRADAVRALLAAGADPAAVARNAMRVQPLHSAVAARALDVVDTLLAAGAPPDAAQQKGWTALMSAAIHDDAELAERLLAAGASRAPRDEDGLTASDLARSRGHGALAERLRP